MAAKKAKAVENNVEESVEKLAVEEQNPDVTKATPIFTNASGGGKSWNLMTSEYDPTGGGGSGSGGASGEISIAAIKALMGKPYGLLLFMFDNDEFWYFTNDEDGELKEENFEVVDGIEFVRRRDYIYSKKGGPGGGISKADIPVWLYKPVGTIQGVMMLENKKDLKYVDKGRLFVI